MNLKDKCEELGISLAEGKEKYGLTHWNQTVPEDVVEIEEEVVEPVVETKSKEDLELIELSIRGAGVKSPYWNKRHLIGR